MDLSSSFAYGNHQSDIPLLELVGHAHAVEPTEQLRKTALEKGWPILTFR
jgi:phosphoserine phosphatase